MKDEKMGKKMKLKLEQIRADGDAQSRVALHKDVVKDYAELYCQNVDLPPLQVMHDGDSYWLWDGFHRLRAAEEAGKDRVPCEVTEGTCEDAQWASCAANQAHGLRRTNGDKERAVKRALKHPTGTELSDSQIAEHVGVSDKTVGKYRAELVSTSEIPRLEKTTGKDGRKRRRPAQAPADPPQSDPGPTTGECDLEECKPELDKCERRLSQNADSEPLLCPVCEVQDCEPGNDRCPKCIADDRTLDELDDDMDDDMDDDKVSPTKQTAPDLLEMASDIRLAIAAQKDRLETMKPESDADLLADIADTSQSLSDDLSELARMAERQAEDEAIVEHGVRLAG